MPPHATPKLMVGFCDCGGRSRYTSRPLYHFCRTMTTSTRELEDVCARRRVRVRLVSSTTFGGDALRRARVSSDAWHARSHRRERPQWSARCPLQTYDAHRPRTTARVDKAARVDKRRVMGL